jgi:hypothetical protein
MRPGATGDEPERPLRALTTWLAAAFATVTLVVIYLVPVLRDPGRIPPGLDTPGYVWRARTVYEQGLEALPAFPDRPGHPILVSVLRDVTGATPLDLARIWPAVIAVGIGLATIALARVGIRERPFVAAGLALGVAGSAFVAQTAVGYAANLLVDLFIVAAVGLAFRVVDREPGLAAIGILIVAAVVTHWLVAVLLIGLLVLVAVSSLVWPPVASANGDPRRGGRRLLVGIAVSAVLGGLALLLAPSLPTEIVHQTFEGDVDRRIEKRLPALALEATLPAAAACAIAIAALGGPRRRRTLPTLVGWAAIAPAGLVAWYGLHLRLPPYRTAGVALGIPALIVLGSAAPASALLDRGRRAAGWIAAALLVAACAWLVGSGSTTWWRAEPAVQGADLAQAATLDAYLRGLPPGTTAVVPLPNGASRPPRILRLGMEAAHADAVALTPADLSDGTDAFVDEVLRRDQDAVVVFLDAYRRPEPGSGIAIGPGVTLVHGPRPGGPLTTEPIRTDVPKLLRASALAVGVLVVTGLGWTLALTGTRVVDGLGLAPATGAAGLVIVGLVLGRIGVSYAGGGGAVVVAATAVTGWLAWFVGRSVAVRPAPVPDD